MDKKSIAILLVASSFASSSFATSIVSKLIAKHHSGTSASITQTHKVAKKSNNGNGYTDFTGTWVGDCGDGEKFTTTIENGSNYIELDGEHASIGKGLQGTYRSDEYENDYSHASFEWNKDGSALIMKSVEVFKDNEDSSAIQTLMSTFNLTMKNGQMMFDGKVVGFNDLTQVQDPITLHCVFTKTSNK